MKFVFRSTNFSSRSLGMVMRVSTCWPSWRIPSSATLRRRDPSKLNGLVTTATVRAPTSCAICAMIGAAPVPVPPPMPQVMNTMSEPSSMSKIFLSASSAAFLPTSGLAPAPRPRVSSRPSCSLVGARVLPSACASVLAAMNSTPNRPASIIRFTELHPPPPTPITLIRAGGGASSRKIPRSEPIARRISGRLTAPPLPTPSTTSSNSIMTTSQFEKITKRMPQPGQQAAPMLF